jgi:dynactin complex subunit
MSTEIPLQLNDPVSIESPTPSSSGQQLHGIVAYLGPVEFSEQAQDFVGVRLTGASVGLGKHDGVVNGKRYFEAGPNGGIFIRYSLRKITKRVLSRLQELQLKRELGASSNDTATVTGRHNVSSVLAASEDTVCQKNSSPTLFGNKITSPSADTPTIDKGASATTGTKSRLDEIRKKREAAMMASTTARSGKSSEDNASTTSSVSNSSSFTSLKGGVAPSSKNNTSAKDNLSVASCLKELRLKRDSS